MSTFGMSDVQTARVLGLLSLGVGAAELMFGQQINQAAGLGQSAALVRATGARNAATGYMIRMYPDRSGPVWMRVIGHVLDGVVVLGAINRGEPGRDRARLVLAALVGATVLDVATAASLTRRSTRARATARRTRVK